MRAPYRPYTIWDWIAWVIGTLALVTASSILMPCMARGQDTSPPPAETMRQPGPYDALFEEAWKVVALLVMTTVTAILAKARAAALRKLDTVITGVAVSGSPQAKAAVQDLARERGLEDSLHKTVVATEARNSDLIVKKRTTMSFDPSRIQPPEEPK